MRSVFTQTSRSAHKILFKHTFHKINTSRLCIFLRWGSLAVKSQNSPRIYREKSSRSYFSKLMDTGFKGIRLQGS